MAKCEFTLDYSDPETGGVIPYECPRTSTGIGKYCLFHDPKYHESRPDEVVERFRTELASASPESFVGCHLPSFEVSFDKNHMCFNSAVFHGRSIFHKSNCSTLDFTDARFCDDVQIQHLTATSVLMRNLHFGYGEPGKRREAEDEEPAEGQYADDGEPGKRRETEDGDKPKTSELGLIKCKIGKLELSTRRVLHRLIMDDSAMETCRFFKCKFYNGMSADKCTFSKDAAFMESTFMEDSRFTRCRFKEGLDLDGVSFGGHTSFDHVIFNSPGSVTFEDDLSNVSFAGTDISRVDFGVNVKWGGEDGHTIYDERHLLSGTGPGLKQTVATYRGLRENREFRLMYSAAGMFFVKEMELLRNFEERGGAAQRRSAFRRRASLRFAYKCISDYGEKPGRLLIYAGILLAGGMWIFYPEDQCAPGPWCCPTWGGLEGAFGGLLKAIFDTGVTDLKQLPVRLPALFLTGMAFISLRRIYERRFRH